MPAPPRITHTPPCYSGHRHVLFFGMKASSILSSVALRPGGPGPGPPSSMFWMFIAALRSEDCPAGGGVTLLAGGSTCGGCRPAYACVLDVVDADPCGELLPRSYEYAAVGWGGDRRWSG